jgi:hypothetical protein
MNILAIDTGQNGGLAFNIGPIIEAYSFKDATASAAHLRKLRFDRVILEKATSSPLMGVKSSFTFGENYGIWQGALASLQENPVEILMPAEWIRWFRTSIAPTEPPYPERDPTSKQKEFYTIIKSYNKTIATSRFPLLKVTAKNCDALLIWQYASQQKR